MKQTFKFRVFSEGKMHPVTKLLYEKKDLLAYIDSFLYVRNPENLMMFTGFKDINGVEVCQGDLLAWPENHDNHENDPMPVIFEYGVFQIDGSAIWDYAKWIEKGSNKFADPTYRLEELEVVGNIYDSIT
jgi:hypothetical protein